MIGGVGQRMLTGVAKKTAAEFFTAVDDVLTGPVAAPAAVADRSRPPAARRVRCTGRRRGPGRRRSCRGRSLARRVALLGALVGGFVARLGVRRRRSALLGRMTAAGQRGYGDACVHRGGGPDRAGAGAADGGQRQGQPGRSASSTWSAASRRPAPSWSCCPRRRPPVSRPASPPEELWDLVERGARPGHRADPGRGRAARRAHRARHVRARPRARARSTTRRCWSARAATVLGVVPQDAPVLRRGPRRAAAGSPPATRPSWWTPSLAGSA